MKHRAVLAAIVAMVGACATHAKFEAKMNRFIGQPEGQLVGMYGPPQASYQLNDGSRVLQYTRGGTMVIPGAQTMQPATTNTTGNLTLNQGMQQTTGVYNSTSTTYVPHQAPGTAVQFSCTVNFTIDQGGIIRQWRASGNHCVSDG